MLQYSKSELVNSAEKYEGWNFNSGNYLFTTDTK